MPDYKQGKVYAIRSKRTGQYYIGSTALSLRKRLNVHRARFNLWTKTNTRYMTSFEILKFEDAYIELIEYVPCDNQKQLAAREGELIRRFRNQLVNKRIDCRTQAQWYQDHKVRILAKRTQRYEVNKERLSAQAAVKVTCECGATHRVGGTVKHKKTEKHQAFLAAQAAAQPEPEPILEDPMNVDYMPDLEFRSWK